MPKRASTPKPTPTSTPTPTPTPTPARGAVTRYVALLRGINVGGHRVSMATLRDHFSALGLARVETYIASGNVLFEVPHADTDTDTDTDTDAATPRTVDALESMIEAQLERSLGYAVSTFVRTSAELADSLAALPFDAGEVATEGYRVHIGFLRSSPSADVVRQVEEASTSYDTLRVVGREMYWLTRGRFSDTQVKWPALERATQLDVTMRNMNTV